MKHGRLAVLAVLWACASGVLPLVSACYGDNCVNTLGNYGSKPGEGDMIDEDTWESTPIDGKWLHFPSGHIWFFDVPALGDRKPYSLEVYISPVEDPNVFHADRAPANFSMAGGNLAELSGVDRNRFVVRNGTCAEYYMRVVAHVPPKPDSVVTPAVDAGIDAGDAGVEGGADAALEAGSDADTDAEAGP